MNIACDYNKSIVLTILFQFQQYIIYEDLLWLYNEPLMEPGKNKCNRLVPEVTDSTPVGCHGVEFLPVPGCHKHPVGCYQINQVAFYLRRFNQFISQTLHILIIFIESEYPVNKSVKVPDLLLFIFNLAC